MSKSYRVFLASLFFLTPLFFVGLSSRTFAETEFISFFATIHPQTAAAGKTIELDIDMDVQSGFEAYVDMLKIQWINPKEISAEIIDVSPTKSFQDPFTQRERDIVEKHGQLRAKLLLPETLEPGVKEGEFKITYQVCSVKKCLLPKEAKILTTFTVLPAEKVNSDSSLSVGERFEAALSRGTFWAFIFVFIGGFLTSLTPCVFPMIPITISIIGARASGNKRSRSFLLSLTYVLGIAFTYSLLGVIAASSGAVFGNALGNIYVAIPVSLIFFVMGLSMLGLFEIQVPLTIRNKFGSKNTGAGLPGAFFAGLFSGIVASPCIGPVLVAILTFVAKTAHVLFGFALLFTFALGMGVLFIVLGTFTGLIAKLPKSGKWMNATKYIFGFILILMSLYYLWPVINHFQKNSGTKQTQEQSQQQTPEQALSEKKKNSDELQWLPYNEKSIADAKSKHTPVIIDFAADWCVACHELDRYTYKDKSVMKEASRFLLMKVDATDLSSNNVKPLIEKFKVVGLPTVIFIDGNGHVHEKESVLGFEKPPEFLKILKEIN
jgi:thiol:disulfide interchange protein DsbD